MNRDQDMVPVDRGCRVRRKSRGGFTLIEVLVVVAIIAVLAAVLLPALQEAREASRSVDCKSQMHQMAIAFHYYAGANGEALPVYWDGQEGVSWIDLLAKYLEEPPEDFRCKSGEFGPLSREHAAGNWTPVDRFGRSVDPATGASYGINYYGIQIMWDYYWHDKKGRGHTFRRDGGYAVLKLNDITGPPSRFSVSMDGSGSSLCVPDGWLDGQLYAGSGEMGPDYRHGAGRRNPLPGGPSHIKAGRANFAFVDGHVESLDHEQANRGSTYPWEAGGERIFYNYWDPVIPK